MLSHSLPILLVAKQKLAWSEKSNWLLIMSIIPFHTRLSYDNNTETLSDLKCPNSLTEDEILDDDFSDEEAEEEGDNSDRAEGAESRQEVDDDDLEPAFLTEDDREAEEQTELEKDEILMVGKFKSVSHEHCIILQSTKWSWTVPTKIYRRVNVN